MVSAGGRLGLTPWGWCLLPVILFCCVLVAPVLYVQVSEGCVSGFYSYFQDIFFFIFFFLPPQEFERTTAVVALRRAETLRFLLE